MPCSAARAGLRALGGVRAPLTTGKTAWVLGGKHLPSTMVAVWTRRQISAGLAGNGVQVCGLRADLRRRSRACVPHIRSKPPVWPSSKLDRRINYLVTQSLEHGACIVHHVRASPTDSMIAHVAFRVFLLVFVVCLTKIASGQFRQMTVVRLPKISRAVVSRSRLKINHVTLSLPAPDCANFGA